MALLDSSSGIIESLFPKHDGGGERGVWKWINCTIENCNPPQKILNLRGNSKEEEVVQLHIKLNCKHLII